MSLPRIDHIVGPRVVVRPVDAGDLPDLLAINGDPEVTAYLPYATWTSLDDGSSWLNRMTALEAKGTGQQLVVARRADQTVIGTVLLFNFEEGSGRFEIGYVLGRAHWQQGLMSEALLRVCDHAFRSMGIRRIEAEVDPANVASSKLLERLGFVLEGCLRKRWIAKGAAHDTSIYGCLADEWRKTTDQD